MTDRNALIGFLSRVLRTDRFVIGEDPAGVWVQPPVVVPIRAVGLALAAWPGLATWAAAARLDALILHRPWGLIDVAPPPPTMTVLAYHLAFDERLTLGDNPWLAEHLGLNQVETIGRKQGRPLGIIGDLPEQSSADLIATLAATFGGIEETLLGPGTVSRAAVVGAMTAPLVEEAARRGAAFYLTGQLRQPALVAVAATGIGVVAVGHRRSEVWGLRTLSRLLATEWPGLRVLIAERDNDPSGGAAPDPR